MSQEDDASPDVTGETAAIKAVDSDLVLLSVWTIVAAVLVLLTFWHLVFVFFHLGIISNATHLARLKRSDGRNPSTLANHLCSVANAVVCCAVALPVYVDHASSSSFLGALLPLWSRPLAIAPLCAGTRAVHLSLAAYCAHAFLLGYESAVEIADHLVLGQRALLALLAACVCMVDFVPEVSLAMLMLEVPSPFWALWRCLIDFRACSDQSFSAVAVLLVGAIVKLRLLFFGACLICTIGHPDCGQFDGTRYWLLFLCLTIYALYLVHFVKIYGDAHRQITSFSWARQTDDSLASASQEQTDDGATLTAS